MIESHAEDVLLDQGVSQQVDGRHNDLHQKTVVEIEVAGHQAERHQTALEWGAHLSLADLHFMLLIGGFLDICDTEHLSLDPDLSLVSSGLDKGGDVIVDSS